MNRARALYHMVRADFLERVRRTSFLLALGFSLYLGYAVYAGEVTLEFGDYRGVNNSAWLGAVIGLVASVWLTLIGFYIVKNAIQRDRQTRVGQILATTPMHKGFYTLGKALSNFAVLASMVLILALAAVAIQLSNRADPHIDWVALLGPMVVLGLSAVAVTAALAVLFESLPVLRGGVGNVFYFFLWTALIVLGVPALEAGAKRSKWSGLDDYTGLGTLMGQMRAQVQAIDPHYNGSAAFSVGGLHPTTKTFLWTGVHWTETAILTRLVVVGAALALALLAALFFDRFDPAREWGRRVRNVRATAAQESAGFEAAIEPLRGVSSHARSAAQLSPLPGKAVHGRPIALIRAEILLMFKGRRWWWYAVAAGLFAGCLFAPMDAARSGVLAFAWIWPMLMWSAMGTREGLNATGALVFSAPRAAGRQLIAVYLAGVVLAAITGGGLALHMVVAGQREGLGAWAAATLFIPALALALGVVSGSRKPFEALYTAWWYVGPLHHIRKLDFMGTTARSSTALAFAGAAVLLVCAAYAVRKVKLAHA
jgi:hypothetical protein